MIELYINNIKADLTDDDISLKYNSNLLTDVSKVVSNNSYTIRLPVTANNLRIIKCSHIPSAESNFPYVVHDGKLVKDGITIVEGADVVMLSVSDELIEIALTWGNVKNMSPLKDLSLRDLRYTGSDYIIWNKGTGNTKQFPKIDYGFNPDEQNTWYHPAVSIKWILDRIGWSSGISFIMPEDRMAELENLFIPILDRNDSKVQSRNNSIQLTPKRMIQTNFFKLLEFTDMTHGDYYFSMIDEKTLRNNQLKTKVEIHGFLSFTVTINGNNGDPNSKYLKVELEIRNKHDNGTPILATIPAELEHISGNEWKYSFSFNECSFELEPGYEVSFTLKDIYTIGADVYHFSLISSERGSIVAEGMYENVSLGGRYFVIPNLPDMKQIDFLKAIANMLGLFAVPTSAGKIKLISFDKLMENKSRKADWTNRVIGVPVLKNTEYSLEGMARVNYFKYKEEDYLTNEGSVYVNDQTIEYEKDAVVLPFAPSKMRNGVAVIPLYSYENGELRYNPSSVPRILRYDDVKGVFTGLSWNILLEKYYASYKELVNNTKIITVMVRLSPLLLSSIDMTIPVYLAQYGSYFAIICIKTQKDNICEAKLLKI